LRVSFCPSCGYGNQPGAKFCSECGATLVAAEPLAHEERKVVSVLFADLVGFTSRAEQMDPEDVRALLSPYYARLRAELERFGGTVEKFIGDAVMALFGAPVAREDDPERAVRAALAIRDWVREEERIQVRLAVSTGDALIMLGARSSEGEGMAAGDVVNTAARLQAAAPVNGVLVGERTFRATRQAIEYCEAAPVEAKGKREPVPVWEALGARARFGVDVPHQAKTALMGRERELGVLRDALARVRSERSPQLVTLVGVPGIGKSRLLYELSQIVEAEAELISWRQGRSLPYGDGISFWALSEMVKAQAGILESDTPAEAGVKLAEMTAEVMPGSSDADWVQRHLGALAGLGSGVPAGGGRRGEVFAAWRQFFEALAERRPLVLVFEDLHWADDGLLDFVDYLADWAGQVPLLVVGTARPELLTRRPGWGGGKPDAVTLSLAALSDQDTARLIGSLLGRPVLEAGQQAMLLLHAGGNPLYAEQYVQMLAEQVAGPELPLPESIQGIVSARLDLLAPPEKRLLQDAAVVGKVFWPGAVAALGGTPGHGGLEEYLHGLERKQFIRRERRSSVAGETQYAFVHVLLRDVAYGQIPRAARADRHAQAAGWIESLGRPEDHAEMLAHHYLSALDLARAAHRDTADLAPRARTALHRAGDRAFALNAFAAAAGYYRTALALWPQDAREQRACLLRLLGTALYETGELDQAGAALTEGSEAAAAAGLPALQARILVRLADVRALLGGPEEDALAQCEAAIVVLDAESDLEGLAEAWQLTGQLLLWLGQSPADQEALGRAMAYARQSGNRRVETQACSWLLAAFVLLPIPADEAIARAEQLLQIANGEPWAEADILVSLSMLYPYAGRFADAREAIARAQSVYGRRAAKIAWAMGAAAAGGIELIAGNAAASERHLREAYETFRAMGERGYLSTLAGYLAEALYAQGRLDEAQQMTEEAQAAASPADLDAQARWRAARAKVLARSRQFPAARALLDEAEALVSPTSWAALQGEILMARAEVDRLAGAREQAKTSLHAALRIYQDRRATHLADQAAAALASLAGHPSAKPA
jgi:class 3 adenylate cyclase/tetratricopeptide (TPR) repeat protein